jgi:hypothetical protein
MRTGAEEEVFSCVTELTSASREELIEIVQALLARVKELEEEVRRLRQGKGGGAALAVKPSRPEKEKQPRKHRVQGFARRREEKPDEVVQHAVQHCPDCGRQLSGGWKHASRQVIEISFRRRVVEHQLMARRCGICGKRWLPKVGPGEIGVQGQRRFGASVQSLVTLLSIGCRTPVRTIGKVLWELGELSVSNGAIVKLLDGTKAAGAKELERLREQVRSAPAVCADETGWRQDGENGYLWGFFTPTDRYFEYRKSRAAAVPGDILGEDFGGTITCDFYAAYNKLGLLQRCWPHLLRDAKEVAQLNGDRPEVVSWVEALRALYQEAKAACLALGELPAHCRQRQRERRRLEKAAAKLARPYANDADAPQRLLAQRVMKHLHELFVFVSDPRVPGDNNLAERSLRPAVIARKISGGTRSAKGSATRMGLMSLLGTWSAQQKPLLASCRNLLLSARAP